MPLDVYAGLEEMRDWIARSDWPALDAEFGARHQALDSNQASRIAAVQTSGFESALATVLARARSAIDRSTKAVYWELDPDNEWASAFFLCLDYRPEAQADDEWASDFYEDRIIPGPSFPELLSHMSRRGMGPTGSSAATSL